MLYLSHTQSHNLCYKPGHRLSHNLSHNLSETLIQTLIPGRCTKAQSWAKAGRSSLCRGRTTPPAGGGGGGQSLASLPSQQKGAAGEGGQGSSCWMSGRSFYIPSQPVSVTEAVQRADGGCQWGGVILILPINLCLSAHRWSDKEKMRLLSLLSRVTNSLYKLQFRNSAWLLPGSEYTDGMI